MRLGPLVIARHAGRYPSIWLGILFALSGALGPVVPVHAASCQFILGFQALHDLAPAAIGDCLDNQYLGNADGDQWQDTTNGLMVWRKADNFTAFTNGYMTWINGPDGLAHRLNTDRFPWEADYGSVPTGSSEGSASRGSAPTSGSGGSATQNWGSTPVSPTAIPLGDMKVTSTPQVGYVVSCNFNFRGGGAQHAGPWLSLATSSWDATTKPSVEGATTWPDASHSFTLAGSERVLQTNDLPVGASTGNFPISQADPVYQYDRNPNSVEVQSFSWTVPAMPSAAATPACTGLGPIGVMIDGVALFNALDAAGRDAGAHEIQDSCGGHPQQAGIYHYHTFSPCLATTPSGSSISKLVGYALDGYGIFEERDASGNLPTDADLDACHGRTSTIMWDGQPAMMYHYDVTLEYPYTVGCFHGTPVAGTRGGGPA